MLDRVRVKVEDKHELALVKLLLDSYNEEYNYKNDWIVGTEEYLVIIKPTIRDNAWVASRPAKSNKEFTTLKELAQLLENKPQLEPIDRNRHVIEILSQEEYEEISKFYKLKINSDWFESSNKYGKGVVGHIYSKNSMDWDSLDGFKNHLPYRDTKELISFDEWRLRKDIK